MTDSVRTRPLELKNERYVQERLLGQGGMGAVYLVRDRETGEQLALKKLFHMDGRSVLRLKREFRSVADLNHPNLVKVYELSHTPDGLFLTMEYVPGQDLHGFLELDREDATSSRIDVAIAQAARQRAWIADVLLPTFHQLATGIRALHRRGVLHRDLKPSNVIVSGQRVVVLDFGLARELDPSTPALTEDGAIAGTPAYMAPEQALGKPLTEASDWYAFGVILYEALTGYLPFDGTVYELLRAKLERDPEPPESHNAQVPRELSSLCMALLARDPALRPSGSDVQTRLEPAQPPEPTSNTAQFTGDTTLQSEQQAKGAATFFGRTSELGALSNGLAAAESGGCTVLHVRGVSGAGKSALIEHFLEELDERRSPMGDAEVLVLRSRCYEREAIPFKALDGMVDALAHHLSRLPDYEVSHLMPSDIVSLTQLFPVLERLRTVQQLLTVRFIPKNAAQNRQRGEAAFHELLSRLSSKRPLVMWIDDLQWGDLDSAEILKRVLQQSVEMPLLLLLSYRSDEVDTSECLRILLSASDSQGGAIARVLDVPALAPADMAALCREQLGDLAAQHDALVEHIVREAHGSPFLAAQLTALAAAKLARGVSDLGSISLTVLVAETDALLPDDARVLLRVLSIAGRPIPFKLAVRAAGFRHGAREIVHTLRRQLLVRTRDVAGDRFLEVYHDRVRESVQRVTPQEQIEALHAKLLAALEYSGRADSDWLYVHALGAKQDAAALRYGLDAAERAMGKLAFAHAAELFASCVERSHATGAERGALVRKWAEALACCGRGGRAADAYLEATKLSSGAEAQHLLQLATSHLLRSGRFEEGEASMRVLLDAMQLRVPHTPAALILAILWEQFRLFLRGSQFRSRREEEIPASTLARIDAFTMFRIDRGAIDPLSSAWFTLRGLRLSLDAGEPTRILHTLIGQYFITSMGGTRRAQRHGERLLDRIKGLSDTLGTSAARGAFLAIYAIGLWMRGRLQETLEPAYEAERLCREDTTGGGYYLWFAVISSRIGALWQLGEFKRFAAELQRTLEEAQVGENVAAQLTLALNQTLLEHIQARPEESIARLMQQRAQLPARSFGVYHTIHMLSVWAAAIASGRHAWGLELMEQDYPRFERSVVSGSVIFRQSAATFRNALLLARYVAEGRTDVRMLSDIRRHVAKLEREHRGTVRGISNLLLRARVAYLEHDSELATACLRTMLAAPTCMYTEYARFALGRLTGGGEGEALCREAERRLLDQGVVDPAAYLRCLLPELDEPSR